MKIQLTIISLMGLSIAQAQDIKPVKTYYVDKDGKQVNIIDSASYIRTIGLIKNSDKSFDFTEYYLDKVVKKTGKTNLASYAPPLYGNVISYSPKGIKVSEEQIKNAKIQSGRYYFLNGKLKKSVNFDLNGIERVTELNDSLGKPQLDENKSGNFKITDESENLVTGSYLNGFRDGEWRTYNPEQKETYSDLYESGKFLKGQLTEANGKTIKYKSLQKLPEFPGGFVAFATYLRLTLRFPKEARDARIEGKVYISFVVEKDGSITEAYVVKGRDSSLDAEALRVVSNSPEWLPGTKRGKPVRTLITVPIFFQL
jgi:TonB family protein